MKRFFLTSVVIAVILTGCQTGKQDDGNILRLSSEETQTETQSETETESIVRAEFSRENIFISLELPSEWEYKIVDSNGDNTEQCGIIFGPAENEDLRYELYYHSFYGICGTGVTIEELQLENGKKIHRYSETIENELWRNIVFEYDRGEDERGSYVLAYFGDVELIEQYEEKLDAILETVVVGR